MFFSHKYFIIIVILFLHDCGGGGSSESKVPPSNSSTASISANLTKVFLGNSAVITWSSSNASSCAASGNWSGDKSTSGSETFAMTNEGEQVFTITCGDISSNVAVTVSAQDFEGSCVNPHNAGIPRSYIGEYEIPLPQNSFGDEHRNGMGLKDHGGQWIYKA